jgi:NAD-dependent dihydropyrimidine dehydrogenase PreA subunit
VKIPVIGCGGVMKGLDAVEHIMAGASAVQICTASILYGPSIYGKVTNEIEQFMRDHGYDSLEDMRGIALKYLPKRDILGLKPPLVNAKLCTNCGMCERVCPYDAIRLEETGTKKLNVTIDKNKCYRCGLCVSICPKGVFYWGSFGE